MAKSFNFNGINIKHLISYNPSSGECKWLKRSLDHYKHLDVNLREWACNSWNAKFSNKACGTKNRKDGYVKITILSKSYNIHRIIWLYMTGEWPDVIDHIDGNPANNKWNNLRNVTQQINMKNQKIRKRNKSGKSGVLFVKRLNKWEVTIGNNMKRKYLGVFDNLEEAIKIREINEKELGYI